MDKFSADSLRFLLLSSPLLSGEDFALQDKEVGDVARKLSMIWNMYDFFTMYADVDGWEFDGNLTDPSPDLKNPLDQWIVSRVHQLTAEVETHMDGYDVASALKPILPFIDDASNWYVRRSRRRFWKSEDDADKALAYRTLHYVLVRLSVVIAPFVPFLAEELYQKLTGGESVHLLDWPTGGEVNERIIDEMAYARELINSALSFRAEKGSEYKIRQRLAGTSHIVLKTDTNLRDELKDIVREETNIDFAFQNNTSKQEPHSTIAIDYTITPELKREGLMREVVRHVQAARKNAGLNVDDRIVLNLVANPGMLQDAIKEFESVIAEETLATKVTSDTLSYSTTATIEGGELAISLQKAD
jgi:isoleucyl-tRNA synthetase